MIRYADGSWEWGNTPPDSTNKEYARVMPAYLSAYNRLFSAATERSEFEFVMTLVHHESDSRPTRSKES